MSANRASVALREEELVSTFALSKIVEQPRPDERRYRRENDHDGNNGCLNHSLAPEVPVNACSLGPLAFHAF
jgi:hypothetical protein